MLAPASRHPALWLTPFACHADGHYEAGMRGPITIVG
jgi:hypothetical protein